MKKIKQAIVVEGKYDKIKLSNLYDTIIVETDGFRIFNDTKKQAYIKMLAKQRGIIIATDSDGAGFVIRNFIKNICKGKDIYNAYIPDVYGKERRKVSASKEGKLGVEGISDDALIKAIDNSCIIEETACDKPIISMADFFELGLTGMPYSSYLRKKLAEKWDLPEHITGKAFLEIVNALYTYEILNQEIEKILSEQEEL